MATNLDNFQAASTLTGTEVVAIGQGNNLVKTTTQAIADLGSGGSITPTQFLTLSGNTWDYIVSPKMKKTLSANTAITVTNTSNGDSGLIQVTQDATGSRTFSINSTVITINTTANSTTLVGFSNVGGGLFEYSTNIDGGTTLAENWVLPIFNTSNLTESPAGVYTGPNSSWGNFGLRTFAISASQSVRWAAQYFDADNYNAALILMKTATSPAAPNVDFGLTIPGAATFFTEFHQGVGSGGNLVPISALVSGEWYAIYRDGTTGTIRLQRSTDKTTWTTVYTFTETYTGALYIYTNLFNTSAQLANPQYLLL